MAELAAELEAADLSEAALRTYWVARPQRQARWFTSSLERLEHAHRLRGAFMKWTFIGAVIAAGTKLVALLLHAELMADIALLGMLLWIRLAGASSSAYLGQNQRSLRHRYAQQFRAIEALNSKLRRAVRARGHFGRGFAVRTFVSVSMARSPEIPRFSTGDTSFSPFRFVG